MVHENLLGRRFGHLSVVRFYSSVKKYIYWECICDCGNRHLVRAGNLRTGQVTSCGCLMTGKGKPYLERVSKKFFSKIDKTDACWNWIGYLTKRGYGSFKTKFGSLAHRFSYLYHFGDFDPSLCVCHKCDNPLCVRPDHLFLGTQKSNMDDMVSKNRQQKCKGSGASKAKLTEGHVLYIRLLYQQGYQSKILADVFGVKPSTISNIITRKTWSHI